MPSNRSAQECTSPGEALARQDTFRAGERLSDCFGRLPGGSVRETASWWSIRVTVDCGELGMPRLAAELDFPAPSATAARRPHRVASGAGLSTPGGAPRRTGSDLFHGETARFRLRVSEAGCQMAFGTAPVEWRAARATFAARQREFSPNVLLRPIYQDALFPTAAYVGGPSEISYSAQLAPVYARFGLPMPVMYPRKSVTLLNARANRELDALGLSVEDVFRDTAALGPQGSRTPTGIGCTHSWPPTVHPRNA